MKTNDSLTVHPELNERLARVIESDIGQGLYDGLSIKVGLRGQVLVDSTFGHAQRSSQRRLAADSVFSIMSLTKPMTALAILQAVERGKIALNTRVADVIPEFAKNGKQRVTIAQLISHTGGMPFLVPNLPARDIGDLQATVRAICDLQLTAKPGQTVSYSARVSYDVLGEIVRRLDGGGLRYSEIIARDILSPLRMTSTSVGPREDLAERRVPVVATHRSEMNLQLEARDAMLTPRSELPGGGGFSTVADMFRFVEMLRQGGTLEGAHIVSRPSMTLATRNHTGQLVNNTLAAQMEQRGWEPYPAYLGLGFFLRGEGMDFPAPFGSLASPETFGSIGAGSAVAWVDPRHGLSFVALSAGLMDQLDSHLRFQKLSDIVHGALLGPERH